MEDADLDALADCYPARLEFGHKVRTEAGRLSASELSHGQRRRLTLLTRTWRTGRPSSWTSGQSTRTRASRISYTRLLPDLTARGEAVLVISHGDRRSRVADTFIELDSGILDETRPAHDPKLWEFH
jgi:putative ATP-binding cassette transporter